MRCFVLCGCVGIIVSLASAQQTPEARIRVDLQQEQAIVPAGLYGIFMEEINYAFDGGLYAELIQNRSFEEGVLPPGVQLHEKDDGSLKMELTSLPAGVPEDQWAMPWPWNGNCDWDPQRALIGWSLEKTGQATGDMSLTEINPMNAASSRSLALTIEADPQQAGRLALVNSGYWGINVKKDTAYALTFYARSKSFQGFITATLESRDGTVLASHRFGPVESDKTWVAYKTSLKALGTDTRARFVLTFEGRGDLQVDWVSLFPPTYKDQPNGLRPDLAQYLADLKPDFVRYPGGCYAEGITWDQAPDWRTMVCAPQDRPGMWGYWKYRSTDGFGYHEFLQFSEDIGADAMVVVFCGMTVHPQNNWPLDEIDPVIERTLGAIEYAIGPVTSKWGAVRAGMGHPEPFPLKYVEIGNEHPPALYGEYYAKIREAIKAQYPDMTVIMSMYWSGLNRGAIERAGENNIDMVDEHAYRSADWTRSNFEYFDRYKRTPWSVYVGEYASHSQNGDWVSAMGDSLFLMMMERNGDLVKMASYAPLLANVNFKNWGVNLIEFDASRSFAHASYYVQKVFNENRPDVNLKHVTEVLPKPDSTRALMGGQFGLGAWNTQTEFKDLKMYDARGDLCYSDDFATLDHWDTPGVGTWRVQEGVLSQTALGRTPAMLLLKDLPFTEGKVTLKARRVGGDEGFLMFFNASSIDRFLFCNYGAAGNSFTAIQDRGVPEGCAFVGGRSTAGAIENERWYEISLELGRDKAAIFLEGKRVSDARMKYLPSLFTSAGYNQRSHTVVLKATNYYATPVTTTIQLAGARDIGKTGQHIVLQSDRLLDQNTLETPRKIVPRTQPLPECAERMTVTLPPYSVNVLCIPATK